MRLVYVDEAGTSANEPVRIVAAVLVNGDEQYRSVLDDVNLAIAEDVPEVLQNGFHFHAKEIFSGGKNISRDTWSFDLRLQFIHRILALPRKHRLPIAMGLVHRDTMNGYPGLAEMKLRQRELDHMIAFSDCIERADFFLQKYLNGNEIGTIVAEDAPQMKRMLKKTALIYRNNLMVTPSSHNRQNRFERENGIAPKHSDRIIQHIIDVPHFVDKSDAPLLQLADACAFTFRRAFSRQN